MDARMAAKEATPELKKEYQTVKAQADAYSREELWAVFQKYLIKSPETGNELTEPQAFSTSSNPNPSPSPWPEPEP